MLILAPAKINLNLRILGRNAATGFHDIETWMVPLNLADVLHVELTKVADICLTCSDPLLDTGEGNLAWKAAELFLRTSKSPHGVTINLQKHIPYGAGLGGGSSDAAATLLSLHQLLQMQWPMEKLESLAAQLGSDVPFFIRRCSSIARGRGEILTPHPLPRTLELLLLKPPFNIETRWAYERWANDVHVPSAWIAPQFFEGIKISNDLEAPAFSKYLMLPALKLWLLNHPLVAAAGMSGSGSCLFAILRNSSDAPLVANAAKAEFGDTLWTAPCRAEA